MSAAQVPRPLEPAAEVPNGRLPPSKGGKHTPETIEKMRKAFRRRLIREGRMQGRLSQMKPNCLADFDEDF